MQELWKDIDVDDTTRLEESITRLATGGWKISYISPPEPNLKDTNLIKLGDIIYLDASIGNSEEDGNHDSDLMRDANLGNYSIFPRRCSPKRENLNLLYFLSHAHGDHIPLENSSIASDGGRMAIEHKLSKLWMTKLTRTISNLRFQNQYEMNRFSTPFERNISAVFSDIDQFFAQYRREYHKRCPFIPFSLGDYFSVIQSGAWHLIPIPSGHVLGAAGCMLLGENRIRDIIKSMNQADLMSIKSNTLDESLNLQSRDFNIINDFGLIPSLPQLPTADVVYLGDWCPLLRPHVHPIPPVSCKTLIMDTTFGDPMLNLPPPQEELHRFLKWLIKTLRSTMVILFARDYGKPQLIQPFLADLMQKHVLPDDFAMVVPEQARKVIQYLVDYGLPSPPVLGQKEARQRKYPQEKNYLLIVPPSDANSGPIRNLIAKRNAKTAHMTGWCGDPEFREENPADEYFALTDHALFPDIVQYLQQCRCERIYIENGPEAIIAQALRAEGFPVYQFNN
jgi:Cft2 family RNA processing exonuclease